MGSKASTPAGSPWSFDLSGKQWKRTGKLPCSREALIPLLPTAQEQTSEVGGDAPVPSRPGLAPLGPFPGLMLLCWHQGSGWWELAGAWVCVWKPERNGEDVVLITMAWDQLELSNWVNWGENGSQLREKMTWRAWQGTPDENHHHVPTACSFPASTLEHYPGVTMDAAWIVGKQSEPTVSSIFSWSPTITCGIPLCQSLSCLLS